jgi:hypothetical protein
LEPVGDGIKFTLMSDYELPCGILGKFLGELLPGQGEKGVERIVSEILSFLEKHIFFVYIGSGKHKLEYIESLPVGTDMVVECKKRKIQLRNNMLFWFLRSYC